jgi:prolyl oligopeptidase
MLDNTAKTENDVTVEIDRYIAWPGQALAYKIGELKIRELRKKAEDDLGERFNIRDFHDIVLGNGSIPLDLLEEKVNQHISSVLESEG